MKFYIKLLKTTKIDSITVNDRVITEKKVILNIINTYFCSVGENLKAEIFYELNPLTTRINSINNNLRSFNFLEVTVKDVVNVCSTIKTSHGSGVDGISSFFIKTAIYFLARPLSYIFNCSFLNGTFPDSWKVARIAPIFKEGPADPDWKVRFPRAEDILLRQICALGKTSPPVPISPYSVQPLPYSSPSFLSPPSPYHTT